MSCDVCIYACAECPDCRHHFPEVLIQYPQDYDPNWDDPSIQQRRLNTI